MIVSSFCPLTGLDYTKGVINRIKAFDLFLDKYPEYLEKVRLVMLTVPSRADVPEYKRLKKETDEVVGRINGKYATVNWGRLFGITTAQWILVIL